jgi:hypothetical protein
MMDTDTTTSMRIMAMADTVTTDTRSRRRLLTTLSRNIGRLLPECGDEQDDGVENGQEWEKGDIVFRSRPEIECIDEL